MMLNCNKVIVLFVVIFSIESFGADAQSSLEQIRQKQQESSKRLDEQLRKSMEEFNHRREQRPNEPNFGPSLYDQPNKNSPYKGYISLPPELKGKAMLHISCDCNDLVQEGHYCGSHALTHALEDKAYYTDLLLKAKASILVKKAFDKFNFKTKVQRTSSVNIKQVAENLGLDAIYLANVNGEIIASVYPLMVPPALQALIELKHVFEKWKNAGKIPFVKPIFYFYDAHVVLFSMIWDGEQLSIELTDNLNEPIKIGSPLYKAARFITQYFSENEYTMMRDLVRVLAPSDDWAKHRTEFEGYSAMRDAVAQRDAYGLLSELFEDWPILVQTKSTANQLNGLNRPLKLLKRLYKSGKEPIVQEIIIKIYGAMLDSIRNCSENKELKIVNIGRVVEALKKSSKEQEIFSLKDEAAEVFERAQTMKISLNNSK